MQSIVMILVAFVREFALSRATLQLENIALRQQVAALKRERPRPWLRSYDRVFLVFLSLSLPFIPSGLPTAVRLFGTEIILSQRILKLTKGEVITRLIPPDRASEHRAWA
jgi:hypothetical protein